MLRPATPLTILLLVSFVLLLLSVLSTPIIKGIPLATFEGVNYGVFGFCQGSVCTGIKVGYGATDSASFYRDAGFTIAANTRQSLASLLIVHPVAALLTLVCLILAATAHLHAPSHSPRYLLAFIILLLPTILVTLLAFLVDILLFVPHLAWGGWIVLAATILLVASGVVTCGMRRTLVSRKARKKRIAENAEMSGENYYNRQAEGFRAESPPPLSQQPTAPIVDGAPGAGTLPEFATFDASKNRWPEDDRTPLNSRTPTLPSIASGPRSNVSDEGQERYAQGRGGPMGMRGRGGRYNGPRDEFGNPLPPGAAGYGAGALGGPGRNNSRDRPMQNEYSNDAMAAQGFRGRGRGGFMPRGRGGPYGGRGGPVMGGNGRGIPLAAIATGAEAGMMAGEMGRGQRGAPPGYARGGGPGQFGRNEPPNAYGAPDAYARRQSPGPPSAPGYGPGPGYGRQPSPGPPSNPGYANSQAGSLPPAGYGFAARGQSPGSPQGRQYGRNSPPPNLPVGGPHPPEIGQAIEMSESTGSPAHTPSHTPGFAPSGYALRDSDADVAGLVGLQQNRADPSYGIQPADIYVPARAAWGAGPGRNASPPINNPHLPQINTVNQSPVELATRITTPHQVHTPQHARVHSGDNYYEDVDPRFSNPSPEPPTLSAGIPSLLIPGHNPSSQPTPMQSQRPDQQQQHQHQQQYLAPERQRLEPTPSFDSSGDVISDVRSDGSDLTSISRRGINPAWRPDQQQQPLPPGGYGPANGGPGRRPMPPPQQMQRDVLSSNPDFELGGAASGMGRRGPQF